MNETAKSVSGMRKRKRKFVAKSGNERWRKKYIM